MTYRVEGQGSTFGLQNHESFRQTKDTLSIVEGKKPLIGTCFVERVALWRGKHRFPARHFLEAVGVVADPAPHQLGLPDTLQRRMGVLPRRRLGAIVRRDVEAY